MTRSLRFAIALCGLVAVVIGLAAIAGILAGVGAFEQGGLVSGGEQFIRVNEDGEEAVLNARATRGLGSGLINALNAGALGARQLEHAFAANLAGAMPAPASPIFSAPAPSSSSFSAAAAAAATPTHVQISLILVDSRNARAAQDLLESSAGKALFIEIAKDLKTEIGIPI